VLRRARDGRSLEREAAIMRHVAGHGLPVPEVFDADGADIVMARVDGPNMLDDVGRHPGRLVRHARLLATLHHDLGQIDAPVGLAEAEAMPGSALAAGRRRRTGR
jgi:tRNA A-37 threonylcarbamoyl transferase component Bud32